MKFDMILAVDSQNGIGKVNNLPWNIPTDMAYFHEKTTTTEDLGKLNAVVMGKNTWASIPTKNKPLSNRVNCVLSHKLENSDIGSKIDDFVLYFESFEHCLSELESKENVENIWIIGGADLYNYTLNNEFLERIYLTRIKGDFNCDVFFAGVPENFALESYSDWQQENGNEFRFEVYKKIG